MTSTVTAPAQTVTAPPVAPEVPAAGAADPAAGIGAGTYLVGTDIRPGTYRTTSPTDSIGCYWARLKNTSGELDAIIANGIVQGRSTVTVKKDDAALELSGDCTWTVA